jgi:hypothetical protein
VIRKSVTWEEISLYKDSLYGNLYKIPIYNLACKYYLPYKEYLYSDIPAMSTEVIQFLTLHALLCIKAFRPLQCDGADVQMPLFRLFIAPGLGEGG